MRDDPALALRKNLKDFLDKHKGERVKVAGMWVGDFIGTATDIGTTGCEFTVENSENNPEISRIWLPYSRAMVLTDVLP